MLLYILIRRIHHNMRHRSFRENISPTRILLIEHLVQAPENGIRNNLPAVPLECLTQSRDKPIVL
jgi:hypothetical protein